jgi:hypothetical protein
LTIGCSALEGVEFRAVPTGLRLFHGGNAYPTLKLGANKPCAYGVGDWLLPVSRNLTIGCFALEGVELGGFAIWFRAWGAWREGAHSW